MIQYSYSYDTTIFVTAKTRGLDAEREKEKRISTLHSYIIANATIHQEKNLEDRPKQPKSVILEKL